MRVVLYTRADCRLCEEAEDALRKLQQSIRFETDVVYIDDDLALSRLYGDRVPVVVVGDHEVAAAPIDEERLLAALAPPAP